MAPTKKQKLLACLNQLDPKAFASEIHAVKHSTQLDDTELSLFFFNLFVRHPGIEHHPKRHDLEKFIANEVKTVSFDVKPTSSPLKKQGS